MNRFLMFIMFIVFIGVKVVLGALYIDLKNNYISEGVVVYHGRFKDSGKYRMLYGEYMPLDQVYYDKQVIFPDSSGCGCDHIAIVETFDSGFTRLLMIHSFRYKDGKYLSYKRFFYEYGKNFYDEISQSMFMSKVTYVVELGVDIAKSKMHPFVSKKVDNYTFRKETYNVIKEFNGFKLDGRDAPLYTFGYVYDSSKSIMIGYTKVNRFVGRCEYFEIERRLFGDQIVLTEGSVVLTYEIVFLMDKQVWSAKIRADTVVYEEYQGQAIEIMDRIDKYPEDFRLVTLDVSENVSPELFGIEKVSGYVGNGKYIIYQLKKEYVGKEEILHVIDSESKKMVISHIKSAYFTYVEVYKNFQRTVVIITSLMYDHGSYVKKVDVFNKIVSNVVYYTRIEELMKKETIHTFERLYPVRIVVIIDEPPTSIFDVVELKHPKGECYEYRIKEQDGRRIDFRKKYTFGFIWETDPYEKGNIPAETHKKSYVQIKNRMKTSGFRILKYKNEEDIVANEGCKYLITEIK